MDTHHASLNQSVVVGSTFINPIEDMPIKTKHVTKTFEEILEEELAKEQAKNAPVQKQEPPKEEDATKKTFLKRKESILNTSTKKEPINSTNKKSYKYYVDAIAASLSKKKQSATPGAPSGQNTERAHDQSIIEDKS